MQNRIQIGHVYRHFKGKPYVVLDIVQYTEDDDEKIVIYQALYGERKKWARPLSMFESKVDREKYPEIEQEFRFEEIEL